MSLSLIKINYQRSSPIISSEPELCVKMTGIAIISDKSAGGTMWDAILPINLAPEPENITITTSRLVGAGEIKDDVDELLNTHADFAPVREVICDYFFKNIQLIGHIRDIYNCKDDVSNPSIVPLPLFVDNHTKGIVYFSAGCKDSGAKFTWRYEMMKNKFQLLLVEFDKAEPIKSSHLLSVLNDFLQTPNPDTFDIELIQVSNLLNIIDHRLLEGQELNDHISVSYKQSGAEADVRHVIISDNDELSVNWTLLNDSTSLKKQWGGDCHYISFKVKSVAGAFDSQINIDDLPFAFSEILKTYSKGRVENQMRLLEQHSSPNIFDNTLEYITDGKDISEYFSLVDMVFGDRFRKSVISHTTNHKNHYIRVFWDVVSDCSDGFDEWDRAEFSVNHIKIEGIKYSYFPKSKFYDDICSKLPDDFFDKSIQETRKYMQEAHEYFWFDKTA